MPLMRRPVYLERLNSHSSPVRLLTVHGAMDRGSSFRGLAKELAPLEVVIWDRAGYAHSIDVGPFNVEDHLADLSAILDEKPAVVFGHSLGGTYALWLASLGHPNLLAVSTFESPLPGGAWWGEGWDVDPAEAARGLVSTQRAGELAEAFLRRMITDDVWERLPERTKLLRRAEGQAFLRELGQLVSGRIGFDLGAIEVDVTAGISSRPSHHHRSGLNRLMASLEVTSYCVADSHHSAHLNSPKALAQVLAQQLAKVV